MKFDSVLKSNHDLKKNGYRLLRKLHKMETIKGAKRAYAAVFADTYYFVLGCRSLAEIIKSEYPKAIYFGQKCDSFLVYLEKRAETQSKIEKQVLAAFLRSYTRFFNQVIEEKHEFRFDSKLIELWNVRCLMAYIATWGSNH